jgi:hypothetical protein
MIKEYNREEIIEQGLRYRKDFFAVDYSKHALDRIYERLNGNLILYPKYIRITTDNIVKGLSGDEKYLFKIVVKLEWKRGEDIYMVILPAVQLVKTVYFKRQKYVKKDTIKERDEEIKEDLYKEEL